MIEIPEALTLASQINNTISEKQIVNVVAEHTPHKFAWYHGDPQKYRELLVGKTINMATACAGMVEIKTGNATILVGDGVAFRYHKQGEKRPAKHQLLLEFNDFSSVSASVQMYGGIWCFVDEDEFQYLYYKIGKEKPSPISDKFNKTYFDKLISSQTMQKLSIKAFLATEQRIPGLGNGVLQDILWEAKIHPKRKVSTLKDENKEALYSAIKAVLSKMAELGGRDTEKDLHGNNGGYKTMMSKNNVGSSCISCGGIIKKETYLGGSIYYCENCQLL
ncbi:formamidopyrimidine-DNA glycosylase [Desnuesiella massiliensis]|uniref:formamidopyrimidine-DNA glycosylase n=1 Tax=Desnuesiella massiliensis TaxID=1650662 RepID=UPI0006E26E60|nr:formamidopyrimidine-DNA glycosylase [Desnuesiella massiliensis]